MEEHSSDTTDTQNEATARTASHHEEQQDNNDNSSSSIAIHHAGLVIEQPQLSSDFYSSQQSDSGVVVPSPSSRKRNKKLRATNAARRGRRKNSVAGGGKRWRKIACSTLTISSIALYTLLYTTLSSNPTVVELLEMTKTYGGGSSSSYNNEYGADEKLLPEKNSTLYQRNLRIIQKTASTMARIYQPVPPMNWCIDERLSLDQLKRRPMGLCLLRIPHSASSTLKGINMRIATNFGKRAGIKSCIRHDTRDFGMYYPLRDKLSFLWTFLRDPTERAMSHIGSRLSQIYLRERNRDDPTFNIADMGLGQQTLNLLQNSMDITDGVLSEGRGGFQLQFAMQGYIPAWSAIDPLEPSHIVKPSKIHQYISRVFERYDFVGLVERFDESLVAMQLLLGLETSEILYFSTNTRTQWQRARISKGNFRCRKPLDWEQDLIPQLANKTVEQFVYDEKSNSAVQKNQTISLTIREYLENDPEWYAQNYADYVFYQAANQSLDRTILKIGLDVYSVALKDFRLLRKQAEEQCHPKFACSDDGQDQLELSKTDCQDQGGASIGCGYHCLNNVTAPPTVQRRLYK
mmetsp:Transcript_60609/g.148703  ORF Transcript_60609/g.148703 Transcript_60609/m.148703 type:complete len:575 (-) Transcript_60609:102-1826(-)